MFNALEFVKNMYLYSYNNERGVFSPIAFDYPFHISLPLSKDIDNKEIAKLFVDNTLKNKFFKEDKEGLLCIQYSGIEDDIKSTPLVNIQKTLNNELAEILSLDNTNSNEYIESNKALIKENINLINEIANQLQEHINSL